VAFENPNFELATIICERKRRNVRDAQSIKKISPEPSKHSEQARSSAAWGKKRP